MMTRSVAFRTMGRNQGPITRLMSPSDLGEHLKPFVFLDLAQLEPMPGGGMGWHPHSGIATVTCILRGTISYKETTGQSGELGPGGLEWMEAGGGVWHTGAAIGNEQILGFQLWIALPPDRELRPARSMYLNAQDVGHAGPARVLLGEYGGVRSRIDSPPGVTYLDVSLSKGGRWRYDPLPGESVAWLCPYEGRIDDPDIGESELTVFSEGAQAIEVYSSVGARFVFGSAIKHKHPLHLGYYSVHTNADALRQGEARIAEIAVDVPR